MKKLVIKLVSKVVNGIIGLTQTTGGEILGDKKVDESLVGAVRELSAEGIVLLKNNGVLPIDNNQTVSVFGRVQYDYFYVGYGSGGDVKAPYKVNLIDGLKNNRIKVNNNLSNIYYEWCKNNVPDEGFWGHWPRHFEEMPLTDELVQIERKSSDLAIVVIGRSAGEDREQALEQGSYYLTQQETDMLDKVTSHFDKVIVLINSGNLIDLSAIDSYGDKISALLYVWQGGMESGNAIADVLNGRINPSGKLTATVARNYQDYPSSKDFGNKKYNNYTEDIYVGYRYFETFDKESVLFPFGYGLSYTNFLISSKECNNDNKDNQINIATTVQNNGTTAGKEVVQVYVEAPQGRLGKPKRSLVAFSKTSLLAPNTAEDIDFIIPYYDFMSYDDQLHHYILEAGDYHFYIGNSVRDAKKITTLTIAKDIILAKNEIMSVNKEHAFDILTPKSDASGNLIKNYKKVSVGKRSLTDRIKLAIPVEIPPIANMEISFNEVINGKHALDDFIAQLTVKELEELSRGDIKMNSPLGALGNAGAFGGVSQSLRDKGVPPIITTDGPSGIRLMSYASLLPCGTMMASSFNLSLINTLYTLLAKEMKEKGSDVLLAPGMNIQRNPLCGRNFEYFSEDPVVSGKIATAVVNGLQSGGVSACPKHLACNNQESNRNRNDSRVSERALREIYLKGFEICIKESAPLNIMTSYNKINGIWSHYNYDLCTTVLRNEWGYKGCVITDWWMRPSADPNFPKNYNSGYRIRSQVDVLMPGASTNRFSYDNSAYKSYKKGALTLAELQRGAKNVLSMIVALKNL